MRAKKRRRDQDFDQLPPRSVTPPEVSSDPHVHARIVIEVLHCHQCQKKFSARVDYRINGNHRILCAYCGHPHYRVVKEGRVTGERWESHSDTVTVEGTRWSAESRPVETSTVSDHIYRLWHERMQ